MQQIVFTIIEDDRTLLRLGVNEIGAIASKCATGFKGQDVSLSVGIFHRTEWVSAEALLFSSSKDDASW
jgi:hypothetical protein